METSLREVDRGIIEATQAMGASTRQIIFNALLPEARPGIIAATTVTAITLVSYTAMAGVVGAGGNVGAVAAGFLLKGLLDVQTCLMILGGLVTVAAFSVVLIRFTAEHKEKEQDLFEQALLERNTAA